MPPTNLPKLRSYKKNKYIFTYIQSMLNSKFSVRIIKLLGTSLRHSFITLICGLSRKECISFFTCEYFTLTTLALKKMLTSEIKKQIGRTEPWISLICTYKLLCILSKHGKICTYFNISKFTK